MDIVELKPVFPGVKLISPTIYRDDRGYFFETYNTKKFEEKGIYFNIVQENQSKSKRGVIRGLHYQKPPYTQAKIVTVIKGEVLDVIVDIRTDSPTFGQYFSILLNSSLKNMLYIPRGFAHGFITLSKDAIFQYKIDNDYMPSHESGIIVDDVTLNIDWIMKRKLIVNEKDQKLPEFNATIFNTAIEYNQNPI